MTKNYEESRVAVDAAIFTVRGEKLLVYLNRREKEPFSGKMELPGGLLLSGETAEETLSRKISQITGVEDAFFEQFRTFTDPDRDPRTRTVTIAFVALIPETKIADGGKFFDVHKLPRLAFDHKVIIQKAHNHLQRNLDHDFAKQFLPEYFPLNDLQAVYEAVSGQKIDNRNFRKKMLASGEIEKAKQVQKNVPHRPATLFRFAENI